MHHGVLKLCWSHLSVSDLQEYVPHAVSRAVSGEARVGDDDAESVHILHASWSGNGRGEGHLEATVHVDGPGHLCNDGQIEKNRNVRILGCKNST